MENSIAAVLLETDFNLALLPAYAELIASVEVEHRVKELQFSALRLLKEQLTRYQRLGYSDHLLYHIAEKKGWMILSVSSKPEMEKLMRPSLPRYDGNRFIPDAYSIPEEELICWAETSWSAPLSETCYERYAELFQTIFPKKWEKMFSAR